MKSNLKLEDECLVSFKDVPAILPKRRGKRVHYSTVYRWATKGARGRVLESQLIGGVRYTSIAALNQFFETTTIQASEKQEAQKLRQEMYGDDAKVS